MVTFLRHVVRRHAGDRVYGIARAVDLMRRMVECDAAYVADRPEVAAWVSDVSVTDPRLIAAAYLGADFRPLSHAQVVRELAPIGCSFVGRVASADEPVLSSELRAIVDGAANRTIREAYDDLATRRAHRVDVFRLGTVTPGMV